MASIGITQTAIMDLHLVQEAILGRCGREANRAKGKDKEV